VTRGLRVPSVITEPQPRRSTIFGFIARIKIPKLCPGQSSSTTVTRTNLNTWYQIVI
jgi:hypothetical protein